MPTVNFYLRSGKGDELPIILFFSYNSKRFKYSTGLKVNHTFWNAEKQRVREVARIGIGVARSYNDQLSHLERNVVEIYMRLLREGKIITNNDLKYEMDIATGRTKENILPDLIKYVELFIRERAESPKYKKSSIHSYTTLLMKLQRYAQLKRIKSIEFSDITFDFWEKFRNFLYGLELAESTVHKCIRNLKTVLNHANDKGVIRADAIYTNTKRLGVHAEKVQKIYISSEELTHIYNLDLSNNPRLDRVRDLFLIGAYTGLRFSDFTALQSEQFQTIDNLNVIRVDTKKTAEQVIIPTHSRVKEIIQKYNGPPKTLSNQKMNLYLKELGVLAGLTQEIIITKTVGGKKQSTTYKKYELLSTHTARRSFATNAYKAGVPTIAIMTITGHQTEDAFMRYIQITKEENARIMASHPFFQS